MDWFDLLAVQGTLKNLLQHHSSKASILWRSDFFIVQLSHPYMTTGKTIALTRRTFIDKVMCLLFNMLSRLVIIFLPRSKCILISWLQSTRQWQPTPVLFPGKSHGQRSLVGCCLWGLTESDTTEVTSSSSSSKIKSATVCIVSPFKYHETMGQRRSSSFSEC